MTRRFPNFCYLTIACLVLALNASAGLAQSNLGSITGIVTDPHSAVVPEATVTATNLATGVRSTAKSNSTGIYLLPSLPFGTYTVYVEHPGFVKYVREQITLDAGQRLGLDIALTIGSMQETVTVTAEAPPIQDRTSTIDTTIEPKSIEALPLSGRKTLNVVALSGAAVFIAYPNTPTGSPSFTLAGGRGRSQMSYIDGGSSQNSRIGNPLIDTDLPSDAVAEVKLLINSGSAEYGASAGGVVMTTTKSGTNQFHGSLYENFRHDALDLTVELPAPLAVGLHAGLVDQGVEPRVAIVASVGAVRRDLARVENELKDVRVVIAAHPAQGVELKVAASDVSVESGKFKRA